MWDVSYLIVTQSVQNPESTSFIERQFKCNNNFTGQIDRTGY